jgi:hypothetical protein
VVSQAAAAPIRAATRTGVISRASCTRAAAMSASAEAAGDSESTERSHIVTGTVHEKATMARAATEPAQRRPQANQTDVARVPQHNEAIAACRD